MGVNVEIVSLVQEMDLETMQSANALVLKLPNDDMVKLSISGDDAQRIINARMNNPRPQGEEHPPLPPQPTPPQVEIEELGNGQNLGPTNEEGAVVFGGGGTQPEPRVQPAAPAAAQPAQQEQPRRARRVQADERGYPIVAGEGKDPGEVVDRGGTNRDEEGVPSI